MAYVFFYSIGEYIVDGIDGSPLVYLIIQKIHMIDAMDNSYLYIYRITSRTKIIISLTHSLLPDSWLRDHIN